MTVLVLAGLFCILDSLKIQPWRWNP